MLTFAHQIPRWCVITALDVATELIIVALPTWAMSRVKVRTSKKRLVIFVFSFRLLVAGFSIAVLVPYINFLQGSQSELDLVHTIVWQEILLGFSLMSASIPCIRAFLWAFMSMGLQGVGGLQNNAGGSYGESSHLRSYTARNGGNALASPQSIANVVSAPGKSSQLRSDRQNYKVNVRAAQHMKDRESGQRNADQASIESTSSERMIIHRSTEVEVHHS